LVMYLNCATFEKGVIGKPRVSYYDAFDKEHINEYDYVVHYPDSGESGKYFIVHHSEKGLHSYMLDHALDKVTFIGDPVLKTEEESNKILEGLD